MVLSMTKQDQATSYSDVVSGSSMLPPHVEDMRKATYKKTGEADDATKRGEQEREELRKDNKAKLMQ